MGIDFSPNGGTVDDKDKVPPPVIERKIKGDYRLRFKLRKEKIITVDSRLKQIYTIRN